MLLIPLWDRCPNELTPFTDLPGSALFDNSLAGTEVREQIYSKIRVFQTVRRQRLFF
jgi:hypothetical protein